MQITKSFVTHDNTAIITCPKCKKSRNIPVEKYRGRKHTIKIRCTCQHHFLVQLDFRGHYRKETNLDGTYVMVPPPAGSGKLNVLNISRSGIGFTIGYSTQGSQNLIPGQRMRVSFQLDNKKRTNIEKIVTIRNVDDHYIGGEFDLTGGFDKELGFYLQP